MIALTITDAQQSKTFYTIEAPLRNAPILNETDVQTIEGDLATYYTGGQKRNLTIRLGYQDAQDYAELVGFRDRQRTNHAYPLITIAGAEGLNMTNIPCKMTLSSHDIVDECGVVENVQITLRESVQMS